MHRLKVIYGKDAGEFRPDEWEGDELKGIKIYVTYISIAGRGYLWVVSIDYFFNLL
ncbi:hypothetical protein F4824DRAFT_440339, partial [Ustulina deusta]